MQHLDRPTCYDCINFAPVDVFKGICHVSKISMEADADACEEFESLPKCKFCSEFRPIDGERYLGTCQAGVVTYPDLVAKTCESFMWKDGLPLRLKPSGGKSGP
jgi:4-hydroxyphenylacetate decarboxylase small subunit